jgi:hypothetical protein
MSQDEMLQEVVAEEMDELLSEYRELTKEIKSLERQKDNVKANILISLKLANLDSYDNSEHSVRYTMQQRKVLDKIALEKFLESKNTKYEEFVKINQFEMLRVIDKKTIEAEDTTEE